MQQWPPPHNVSQLRGFLGLTRYYRQFIRRYAQVAAQLTQLLQKDTFKWNEEAQTALDSLKESLIQAPVLALPDFSKPFILESDASGVGIRAVFSQEGHLIAFYSKKLLKRIQAQSVYNRELYAITEALVKFRHYYLVIHLSFGLIM